LLSVSGKPSQVDFDPKLIGHAIENILSNAYKYSEEGNLGFDLSFTNTEVKIAISDPGMGIPEDELKNLFQPFYRASNTNEVEGTGLGLAIMKEFVDKHNGKIFVTSILNKGTTVNVILPIKQNQP
jgi:signal transduction histidine kinase